jgi:hypothetical protein
MPATMGHSAHHRGLVGDGQPILEIERGVVHAHLHIARGRLASSICTTSAPNVCAFWLNCNALNINGLLQKSKDDGTHPLGAQPDIIRKALAAS